jgi:prepilin-type N-terminal cleavage/methylation domain-containing protein
MKGFTLVETLMAIAILSIIAFSAFYFVEQDRIYFYGVYRQHQEMQTLHSQTELYRASPTLPLNDSLWELKIDGRPYLMELSVLDSSDMITIAYNLDLDQSEFNAIMGRPQECLLRLLRIKDEFTQDFEVAAELLFLHGGYRWFYE